MWFLCPVGFYRYRSSVFAHHVLYVIESQTESLYIMQVTAGYPVELIEYMWQAGFTDTDSVVGNGDTDPVCLCLCLYGDITKVYLPNISLHYRSGFPTYYRNAYGLQILQCCPGYLR